MRDTYDLGERLLIVATDRISAFDVVLPNGIPDKGAVLTQMSAFWFERTDGVVPNHFIRLADGTAADELPFALPPELIGRSTIVKKAQRLDVECIVRGYISGSAWAEYQKRGTVCGVRMPPGISESEQFPEPIFTPTTKAEVGHDENMIDAEEYVGLLGVEVANAVRLRTLALYKYGVQYARRARHHHRRHEVRVRPGRRRADRHRRDPDAGLEPLLGRGRLPPRQAPGSLRQAVRARLAAADRLEPRAAGARDAGRGCRRDVSPLP